jgi:hypothetical protein
MLAGENFSSIFWEKTSILKIAMGCVTIAKKV